jgi:hypothetical protein
MTYKYCYKPEKIEPQHVDFALIYAETRDSLEAYNNSHKHINKVRASKLLQSTSVWLYIVSSIRKKPHPDTYERRIIEAYDLCFDQVELSPIDIVNTYTYVILDDEPGSEHEIKDEDMNPLHVALKLALAYNFFNIIERKHFLDKIKAAIENEIKYYEMLATKNAAWKPERNKLNKYLDNLNIPNIDKILK